MSFMQPWMLIALPLVLIPIIIHLVNQRRFQTVPWAAMRFLLEASKMSSGYTKLRQWLILAMRTLALLALVVFTARPLTSGIMALLGGDSNRLAIVILDRSPSMSETQPGARASKLEMAIEQLAETFATLGIQRVVQIDPLTSQPEEFASVAQWLRGTPRQAWSATTDIPGLMEQALVYAKNNRVGNTLVWLCSDMRDSDWKSKDGRWKAVEDGFRALPQDVRFSVLDLSSSNPENMAVRVTSAQRVEGDKGPEIALSFRIDRPTDFGKDSINQNGVQPVPVEISVNGNRSILQVDMNGSVAQVSDYRIPIEVSREDPKAARRGWGSVRLPSDSNPGDDISYFVFEQPPTRRTVIVSETPEIITSIELCASIAPQQSIQCEAELVSLAQIDAMDWNSIALIVWHEALPEGKPLELLEKYVASGGQLLLLPPEVLGDQRAFGVQWKSWIAVNPVGPADGATDEGSDGPLMARIAQWQNDSQLLANTLNGAPLPLGQLGIRRICIFDGEAAPLATLPDGQPILAKIDSWNGKGDPDVAMENTGSSASDTSEPLKLGDVNVLDQSTIPPTVILCATTPSDRDSTLAGDGIVLYVTIQRLLAAGAQRVGTARHAIAGTEHRLVNASSTLAAGNDTAPSSEFAMHSGVYENDGLLVAVHRSPQEDDIRTVDDAGLGKLFGSLPWAKIDAGKTASSLVQEIWRWFVVAMLAALLIEAILCLPRPQRKAALTGKAPLQPS